MNEYVQLIAFDNGMMEGVCSSEEERSVPNVFREQDVKGWAGNSGEEARMERERQQDVMSMYQVSMKLESMKLERMYQM